MSEHWNLDSLKKINMSWQVKIEQHRMSLKIIGINGCSVKYKILKKTPAMMENYYKEYSEKGHSK